MHGWKKRETTKQEIETDSEPPGSGYVPDCDTDLLLLHTDGGDGAVGQTGPGAVTGRMLHVTELAQMTHDGLREHAGCEGKAQRNRAQSVTASVFTQMMAY